MKALRPRDAWTIAAVLCLFAGAVLLVVAWYDVSGTANVYEQLPYLVSAGFSGLALIIVGGALMAAGRADRVERRLAQLIDALTEPSRPNPPETTAVREPADDEPVDSQELLAVPDAKTYHRTGCLLLRDKSADPVTPQQIAARRLTPCPVCAPTGHPR